MSHHRCRLGVLADHADAISTYTSGHIAATSGLALAVAARGTELPADRAAAYERALHEFVGGLGGRAAGPHAQGCRRADLRRQHGRRRTRLRPLGRTGPWCPRRGREAADRGGPDMSSCPHTQFWLSPARIATCLHCGHQWRL